MLLQRGGRRWESCEDAFWAAAKKHSWHFRAGFGSSLYGLWEVVVPAGAVRMHTGRSCNSIEDACLNSWVPSVRDAAARARARAKCGAHDPVWSEAMPIGPPTRHMRPEPHCTGQSRAGFREGRKAGSRAESQSNFLVGFRSCVAWTAAMQARVASSQVPYQL